MGCLLQHFLHNSRNAAEFFFLISFDTNIFFLNNSNVPVCSKWQNQTKLWSRILVESYFFFVRPN